MYPYLHPAVSAARLGALRVESRHGRDERAAIRAEGLDPDAPAVVAALDLVRWELEMLS